MTVLEIKSFVLIILQIYIQHSRCPLKCQIRVKLYRSIANVFYIKIHFSDKDRSKLQPWRKRLYVMTSVHITFHMTISFPKSLGNIFFLFVQLILLLSDENLLPIALWEFTLTLSSHCHDGLFKTKREKSVPWIR